MILDTLFFVCIRIVVENGRHFFIASSPNEEVTTACFVVMHRDKGVGHRDRGVGHRDKGGATAFLIVMTRDKGERVSCEGDKGTFKGASLCNFECSLLDRILAAIKIASVIMNRCGR